MDLNLMVIQVFQNSILHTLHYSDHTNAILCKYTFSWPLPSIVTAQHFKPEVQVVQCDYFRYSFRYRFSLDDQ